VTPAAAANLPYALLHECEVRGLHHIRGCLDVGLDHAPEFVGGNAAGGDRQRLELLLHVGRLDDAAQFGLELLRDGGRRRSPAEQPAPQAEVHVGRPTSAMLDTSGSSSRRLPPVTARARIFPDLTCGTSGGGSAMVSRVWPESTLKVDSLLL